MGDRSPKAVQKQQSQKKAKTDRPADQKGSATGAKATACAGKEEVNTTSTGRAQMLIHGRGL